MTKSTWFSKIYGALIQDKKIFLVSKGENWSLPLIEIPHKTWIKSSQEMNQAMDKQLGTPVLFLHCASFQRNLEKCCIESVFVLESRKTTETLPEGKWFTKKELIEVPFYSSGQKSLIEKLLEEREKKNFPPERSPWAKPGWFSLASQWIKEELEKQGYSLGKVEPFCTGFNSCLLQIPTDQGNIYLKASPIWEGASHEPQVLFALANLFPTKIPQPIAIEKEKRWMLLSDFGSTIGFSPTLAKKNALLSQFAQLQIEAISQKEHLLEFGCWEHSLEQMPSQIEELFFDEQALAGLSKKEISTLQSQIPKLQAKAQKLSTYNIPPTLVHGDLHLGNVAFVEEKCMFFDWASAAISHPFFDLVWLYLDNPTERHKLISTYLKEWEGFESPQRLEEAWDLARPLAFVYHALYYRQLFAHMEEASRKGFDNPVVFFLTAE